MNFVLVYDGRNDYYVGDHALLYRDGVLVWEGYGNDEIDRVLFIALGEEYVEVRRVNLPYMDKYPERLEFLDLYVEDEDDDDYEYEGDSVTMADLAPILEDYKVAIREQLNAPFYFIKLRP